MRALRVPVTPLAVMMLSSLVAWPIASWLTPTMAAQPVPRPSETSLDVPDQAEASTPVEIKVRDVPEGADLILKVTPALDVDKVYRIYGTEPMWLFWSPTPGARCVVLSVDQPHQLLVHWLEYGPVQPKPQIRLEVLDACRVGDVITAVVSCPDCQATAASVEVSDNRVLEAPPTTKLPGSFQLRAVGPGVATVTVSATDAAAARATITVTDKPPPPPPSEHYQVCFFFESNDIDNLPLAQRSMLTGLKFRKELEEKGHLFVASLDRNAVFETKKVCLPSGRCMYVQTVKTEYRPWHAAAKGADLPCVCLASREGGVITVYPLPDDESGFYDLLKRRE